MLLIFAVLVGAVVGSFLNVCIDRLPRQRSLLRPGSHCDGCGRTLQAHELVPIASFLLCGGRCRTCRSRIPRRVLIVEVLSAAAAVYLVYSLGLSPAALVSGFYVAVLITLCCIDLDLGILPDKIVLPATAAAIGLSIFLPEVGLTKALLGGLIGLGMMLLLYLLARGGMGEGDVKFAALVGTVVGFPVLFPALIVAAVLGGLVGAALLLSKRRRVSDAVPFGPFLAVGTTVGLLWGRPLLTIWRGL